jgi:hypothetical protein
LLPASQLSVSISNAPEQVHSRRAPLPAFGESDIQLSANGKLVGDVMDDNDFDAVTSRNRSGKVRKAYAPPKIIFSELTHSSTESPSAAAKPKLHGNSPGDVSHTDSTDATS